MLIEEKCKECGENLNMFYHLLNNGDQIAMVECKKDGLYAVVNDRPEDNNLVAVTSDDYNGEHELGNSSIKLPNGDRVELISCVHCGFYAIDKWVPI